MDLPTSLQGLVGETVLQLAVLHNTTKFFLDIPRTSRQANYKTRFGFSLGGAKLVRSENIEHLLGRRIVAVYDGGTEQIDYRKIVFETNPTGGQVLRAVLFFELLVLTEDALLLDESGIPLITEDGLEFLTIEDFLTADLITLEDTTIPKNIRSNEDSETTQYIVQEDNFKDLA